MESKFILKSSDDQTFGLDNIEVLRKSKLIASMLEDYDEDSSDVEEIPIPNVNYNTLVLVMEYLQHEDVMPEIEKPIKSRDLAECGVPAWFVSFINKLTQQQLFDVILAANYLDIPLLLDLGCAKVASMIKGQTPDEIRAIFNIPKDNTENVVDNQTVENAA